LGGEVVEFDGQRNCWEEKNGDSFVAMMRLSSGCLGTFISHWHSIPGWSLTLYGDGIKAVISLDSNKGEVITGDGQRVAIPEDPIDLWFKPGLYAQDEAFVMALALGEKLSTPASDLEDSVKTMRLIEQIAGSTTDFTGGRRTMDDRRWSVVYGLSSVVQ
jgi:predicted dehydrogenase